MYNFFFPAHVTSQKGQLVFPILPPFAAQSAQPVFPSLIVGKFFIDEMLNISNYLITLMEKRRLVGSRTEVCVTSALNG